MSARPAHISCAALSPRMHRLALLRPCPISCSTGVQGYKDALARPVRSADPAPLCRCWCGGVSRWICKQLLPPVDSLAEEEPDSDRASALRQAQALETQLLLTGRREIDGPLESGSGLYPQDYLMEDVRDLSRGQRCAGVHYGSHSRSDWALEGLLPPSACSLQDRDIWSSSLAGCCSLIIDSVRDS